MGNIFQKIALVDWISLLKGIGYLIGLILMVGVGLAVVFGILFGISALALWAVNTLFGFGIEYSLWNLVAMLVLYVIFGRRYLRINFGDSNE